MEIRAYIVNLSKLRSKNNSEVVGAWFTPPIDIEVMKEKIGLKGEYKKYAILDIYITGQGWPFNTNEYTPIEEINRLCGLLKKIDETPAEFEMRAIKKKFFSSFEEMLKNTEDIICYPECSSMYDMARYLINKREEVSNKLMGYINYEAYGHYLESCGKYLATPHGVFEYSK